MKIPLFFLFLSRGKVGKKEFVIIYIGENVKKTAMKMEKKKNFFSKGYLYSFLKKLSLNSFDIETNCVIIEKQKKTWQKESCPLCSTNIIVFFLEILITKIIGVVKITKLVIFTMPFLLLRLRSLIEWVVESLYNKGL